MIVYPSYPVALAIICSLLAVTYSVWALNWILSKKIYNSYANAVIQTGYLTYLAKQIIIIIIISVILSILIGLFFHVITAFCFFSGAIIVGIFGVISANIHFQTSIRVLINSRSHMSIAFRGGTTIGIMGIGLALLSISIFYVIATNLKLEEVDLFLSLGGFCLGQLLTIFVMGSSRMIVSIYKNYAELTNENLFESDSDPSFRFAAAATSISGCISWAVKSLFFNTLAIIITLGLSISRGIAEYPLALSAVSIIVVMIGILGMKVNSTTTIKLELSKGLIIAGVISLVLFYSISAWLIPQNMLLGGNSVKYLFSACMVGFVQMGFVILTYVEIYEVYTNINQSQFVLKTMILPMISTAIFLGIIFYITDIYCVSVTLMSITSMSGILVAYNVYSRIIGSPYHLNRTLLIKKLLLHRK
jgi:K(+)-stimulated pyrophosphate-energized sodium pump